MVEKLEQTMLNIRRNSRLGLLAMLQENCAKPKTKAEIFFSSGGKFSYAILGELLTQCVKLRLLEEVDGRYKTTNKGQEYLKRFEELLKFLVREE